MLHKIYDIFTVVHHLTTVCRRIVLRYIGNAITIRIIKRLHISGNRIPGL